MWSAFGFPREGGGMRGAGGLGVEKMLFLVLVLCSYGAKAAEPSDLVKAVCPNALKMNDPDCQNDGTLRALNNTDYLNCAYCNCPKEWKGAECNLCTDEKFCPEETVMDGKKVKAVSCTSDRIDPTDYEFSNGVGKELSCFCGGSDTTSSYVCQQQPGTNIKIRINPPKSNKTTVFSMSVLQRAGTPSQDYTPPCQPGEKNCLTKERYSYAYPQVWEGGFESCNWKIGDCLAPMEGKDCVNYKCDHLQIQCPPPGVQKCPGWTPLGCGKPENQSKPYWSHHCNPLAIPFEEFPIQFSCKPQPLSPNGTFQCYMTQPSLSIASLGLHCYTGTCVYPHLQPDEHHTHKNKGGAFKKWMRENSEALLLITMRIIMIALVTVAIFLIIRDRRRSLARAMKWEGEPGAGNEYPVESIGFTPNLHPLQGGNGSNSLIPLEGAYFRFSEINCHAAGKHILVNVAGAAGRDSVSHQSRPGSILAIMGPSGAGKTTLLDVLSGNRSKGVTGNLYIDGNHISAGSWKMKKLTGYVHQDDVLPGTSTVFEYLLFHAVLRLPSSISQEEKEARVFSIIKRLGMQKVSHNLIGDQFMRGLSGGEKRRVSICCELLLGPRIMMLDEPTTGLDSTNASKVVDTLADMAMKGITCIMTIHQPRTDVFRTIDRVLLMSGNGQVIYAGPSSSSEAYFEELNYKSPHNTVHVVDYMLDVAIKGSKEELNILISSFWKSDVYLGDVKDAEAALGSPKPLIRMKHSASFMQQVRCISTRLLRNASRHPVLITVNFIANFAVAILLGLLFHNTNKEFEGIQSRLGALFFIILFLSMMSLSSLPIWRNDRMLFLRERDAGVYGTTSYFLSILLFDLIPLRVLPPILFSLISYRLIGLHEDCAACILRFTLVIVLTNVVATLMSMMIGAASPSSAIANTVGSMVVMVLLLFGGFLLNKDQVPGYVSWVANLSYFNYGYEALAINEFHGATNFIFSAPIKPGELPSLRITGDLILCEFGFDVDAEGRDILLLASIGVVCAAFTYLFLSLSGTDISIDFGRWKTSRDITDSEEKGIVNQSKSISNSINPPELSVRSSEHPPLNGNQVSADLNGASGEVEVASPSLASRILPVGFRIRNLVRRGNQYSRLLDSEGQNLTGRLLEDGITTASTIVEKDSLTLSWQNINCSVWSTLRRKENRILQNVHGVAGPIIEGTQDEPASMLFAIMGPSGAGKTTLMDILAGRKRDSRVSGEVFVNGRFVCAREIRKLSGYVLQDDVLPGTSTVYECLLFHAKLRLPSATPQANLEKCVLDLCNDLGLQKVLHSYIGDSFVRGLSGGEKRRLSIACELLEEPRLMFLDEPTTGLDSTNAAKVVEILSDLTQSGTTVVMTIHQPRSSYFTMIKRILMLSGNGQVAYTGGLELADKHLSSLHYTQRDQSLHTADFMLDLIIKAEVDEVNSIIDAYSSSEAYQEDVEWRNALLARNRERLGSSDRLNIPQKYEASHYTQLKALSSRMGRNLYRHPMLVLLNFVSSLLVSFGVGAIYFHLGMDTPGIQNRLGSLFFILMYLGLMSISSMPLWHEGRLLFVRERASGLYGTTSYFLSIIVFDILPMRILPPTLFGIISYFMIGLRAGFSHVVYFILIVILVNVVASTFSMTVAAAIPSTSIANMVACLFILSFTLLGGFFLGRKQMDKGGLLGFVNVLSQFSYVRYAFEALLVNEFLDADGFFLTVGYHCLHLDKDLQIPIHGDSILDVFGFPHSASAYSWNVFALCVFIVVNLGLMFTLVKLRDRAGEPSLGDMLSSTISKRRRRHAQLW